MECINTYSVGTRADQVGDYSIQFVVDNGAGEVFAVQRKVEQFPRKKYNVLALLQLGLDALEEKEFQLADEADIDAARASDLGRRLDRALQALQVG
jgi:hypothetical protein